MSRRHPLRAAMLAVILLVVTLGTTSTSAAAQESDASAVSVSGEFVVLTCPFSNLTFDPDDPTRITGGELDGFSSLISGDFVGVDHTKGTFTLDPETGEVKGYIVDTFHGVYEPDGSAGIMRREGPFQANLQTGESRFEQRITGGTGDFEGSRGHLTILGSAVPSVPCVGTRGTYDGVWSRP